MNKFRRSIKFQFRLKLLNMKKLLEVKEFQLKEPSLITMLLKLKLNTSEEKLKKPLWFKNQLKESMKKFNISPFKLKLFTILKEITTSLPPLKLELNTSASKDKLPQLLEELPLSLDTKLTQAFNKEAELEEVIPLLLLTMLPQLLLLIKLDMFNQAQPLPIKPDTFNLALLPQLAIKLDTFNLELPPLIKLDT